MKYTVKLTNRFKRDYKAVEKRGCHMELLNAAIQRLAETGSLPEEYRDHALVGNWYGHRECHIAPDWLLIYKIERDILVLTLTRTGSHSDLLE